MAGGVLAAGSSAVDHQKFADSVFSKRVPIHRGFITRPARGAEGTTGPDEFWKRYSRTGIRVGTPGSRVVALYRIGFGTDVFWGVFESVLYQARYRPVLCFRKLLILLRLAPRHGFEPRFTAPKAAVLPLDDRGILRKADLLSSLTHALGTSQTPAWR